MIIEIQEKGEQSLTNEIIENSKVHRIKELFIVSLKLGLTSFGGPTAHIGYFHNEYVKKRKWLDEKAFADLVALCQFLPGPASSQVGMGIGMMRAGITGGAASFLGFTLPSVIMLVLFAYFLKGLDITHQGWLHGLKIVAVVIVFQAVLDMGKKLAAGKWKSGIAILAAAVVLLWPSSISQLMVIAASGTAGYLFFKTGSVEKKNTLPIPISKKTSITAAVLFVCFLLILPFLANWSGIDGLELFDRFYRSGALVFGGGHVVLPLLERELVPTGWISKEAFLAGYGATQAVPGPLFTFSSYLGAVIGGWKGAAITTAAIFLPAFLLIAAALPYWDLLRRKPGIQGVFAGVNAAVVGILLAALYNPIFVTSILTGRDFAFAAVLFGLFNIWRLPPWLTVVLGAIGGILFL